MGIQRSTVPPWFFTYLILLIAIYPPPQAAYSELLGGEFGYTLGGTTGSFGTDLDLYFNGTLDLPLFKSDPFFGQKFMVEVMVGHARSREKITLADEPSVTKLEITTFHVFLGGKYKFDKLGEEGSFTRRIQPYLVAGPLFNLFLCRTNEATCGADPLPPELRSRGIPTGSGDVRFDYSIGAGVDFLLWDQFYLGADFRNSFSSPNARYMIFGGRAGFLF